MAVFRFRFLILHPIRSIRHLISNNMNYSQIDVEVIKVYLKHPSVIVEAGAADGVDTSTFASVYPESFIYALEPVKPQFDFLVTKFKEDKNVALFNLAFSDKNEEIQMNVGNGIGKLGGMGSSSLLKPLKHTTYFPEIAFNDTQSVTAVTLDSFLNSNKIEFVDLLWLDIQGKELDVLRASRKRLMASVKLIHIEISRVKLYEGMPNEKELRRFLKNAGFSCKVDKVGAISGNALFLNYNFATQAKELKFPTKL